jgi:hypothetical protein
MINDDQELEQFKRMNLVDFATMHYGFQRDRGSSSENSHAMKRGDQKAIFRIAPSGHWTFFSVNQEGMQGRGGSILDFVTWQENLDPRNIGKARQIIRGHVSPSLFPLAPARVSASPRAASDTVDYARFAAKWEGMKHYPGYLKAERGLTPATIAQFRDHIRLDDHGNTVFRHDDEHGITGWEAKNRTFTGFASGGKKALFTCQIGSDGEPPNIIITESAIDAMSYYQENQTPGLYISFGGGLSPKQKKLLEDALAHYSAATVLIATDADAKGEEYAAIIRAMRPDAQRRPPTMGKDWNDTVCATADFHPHVDTAERQVTPSGLGIRRRGR